MTLEQLTSYLQIGEGIVRIIQSQIRMFLPINTVENGHPFKAIKGKRKNKNSNIKNFNKKNKYAKTGFWECDKKVHIHRNYIPYLRNIRESKESGQDTLSQDQPEKHRGAFIHITSISINDMIPMISQVCYV